MGILLRKTCHLAFTDNRIQQKQISRNKYHLIIIEKISDYANVSFAVVLVSPDDLAYPEQKTPDEAKYRANQNVIFELGYFLGRLGRQNVIVIYRKKKDFEIPDDYNGVLWVEYKSGWYFELIKELQSCNFDVDANKLAWF